jgi:hypothetical protein
MDMLLVLLVLMLGGLRDDIGGGRRAGPWIDKSKGIVSKLRSARLVRWLLIKHDGRRYAERTERRRPVRWLEVSP